MNYYIDSFFKNYSNFSGRCSRKYFWIVLLITILILSIVSLPYFHLKSGDIIQLVYSLFAGIVWLINIIPLISLFSRRVHDVDYSFWYILVPGFNLYILFLAFFFHGTDGPNNFGDEYSDLE